MAQRRGTAVAGSAVAARRDRFGDDIDVTSGDAYGSCQPGTGKGLLTGESSLRSRQNQQ